MRRFERVVLWAAVVVCLSCHRRPLDLPHSIIRIELDNDYSMPYRGIHQRPYHYGILLFDYESGLSVLEDFCPEAGGRINSPAGHFFFFAYDLDNAVLHFDGLDRLSEFRVYTEEDTTHTMKIFDAVRSALSQKILSEGHNLISGMGKPGYESEPVILEPDELFAGFNDDVSVPFLSLKDPEFVVPIADSYALSQGRITIYGVSQTRYVYDVQLFVTNLSRAKYIGTGVPQQEPATMWFRCSHVGDDYIQGIFNYFGKLDNPSCVNTAYILIRDLAGGRHVFVKDITEPIATQEDNVDIELFLDYAVPEPEGSGGAFEPAVDNWDVEWYDIPIG